MTIFKSIEVLKLEEADMVVGYILGIDPEGVDILYVPTPAKDTDPIDSIVIY